MLISSRIIVVGIVVGSLIVNNIVNATRLKGNFFAANERSQVTGKVLGQAELLTYSRSSSPLDKM